MMLVPFINQIADVPSLFCQRMSALPSPLKSPVPATCQPSPGFARAPPPMKLVPFISQIARCVSSSVCQRMSALPSPLKSPVPATCQVGRPGPAVAPPMKLVPFITQIAGVPPSAPSSCQRMSALPSPLKSPVALGVPFVSRVRHVVSSEARLCDTAQGCAVFTNQPNAACRSSTLSRGNLNNPRGSGRGQGPMSRRRHRGSRIDRRAHSLAQLRT